MVLRQFNRDTAYFQIMRDRSMMINAEDLDFEFNDLADYLNKKIVPLVNGLGAEEIPGVNDVNLTNACLLNVGDGTTKWDKVASNNVADNSVPFSKLVFDNYNVMGTNFGSVLATNNAMIFTAVTPVQAGDVLFSVVGNSPEWRKVRTGDIENRSIINTKIANNSIGLEHLLERLVGNEILPNSILSNFIADRSITGAKLQDGIRTDFYLERNLLNSINDDGVIEDNSLDSRVFPDRLINTTVADPLDYRTLFNQYHGMSVNVIQPRRDLENDDNDYYTFTSAQISDNLIIKNYFKFPRSIVYKKPPDYTQPDYTHALNISKHFARNSITEDHIRDHSVVLGKNILRNDLIRKEKLHPSIRAKLGI